ncbi:MAG TPA: hypothetical protein PKD09_20700 [Aggregatilinea sp.]|uniref:hypothetical protein n=1 Tax=Aggregatilinea sp. TaxID=2806333 RepID=UPI002BE0060A|nr:hypothetical protein [Aggregatilinea sp.]HML24088.1 hypothetical protein [Aggregatilinea sp.]
MSEPVRETFEDARWRERWSPWTAGRGTLDLVDGALRCAIDGASAAQYSDAQITDYAGLARRDYPWRPPLRMTVRAWASHPKGEIKGTAGFGFWNQPFVASVRMLPRLPRAAWFFFGSQPNDMALAQGVPGWGWKAAVLDASRPAFLALAPFAPLGFLLMRVPALYRRLWPVAQWALGAAEALLPVDLDEPHTYELEWQSSSVIFRVNGQTVLVTPSAPRGPLGFIAWMDNQYAVVTPQGRFKFGCLTPPDPQWLALDHIEIAPLPPL